MFLADLVTGFATHRDYFAISFDEDAVVTFIFAFVKISFGWRYSSSLKLFFAIIITTFFIEGFALFLFIFFVAADKLEIIITKKKQY